MNQQDIIKGIAKKIGLSQKHAKSAVQTVVEMIAGALVKGTSVRWGLGTFTVSKRNARKGRNPKTGAAIKIGPSKGVRFKASRSVKDLVNKRPTKKKAGRRVSAHKGSRR
ncbi:MAG: HU family DNA-binding protein [Alphaproteobacteria bacterium]|nr:HU family DNA-binding protein [Alphaproteobacteria bacterium]